MKLPVSTDQLPLETEPWDDTLTYRGIIKAFNIAVKTDKNGNNYGSVEIEVTEPEERRGRKVPDNYVPIPPELTPSMSDTMRKMALELGTRLGRMAASCKIVAEDTDDLIGGEVQFTVKNEEYQGRLLPKVAEYLI